MVTADTYTSVLPQAQRRCADATAALVLAAARRTGEKIKSKGRKNRPATRRKTGAPTPTAPRAGTKGQVRAAKTSNNQRGFIAPNGHPPSTSAINTKRPTAFPQVGRLTNWARPKGLEPPTSDP